MKTSLVITAAIAPLIAFAPPGRAVPPEVEEAHDRVIEAHQRAFGVVKEIRNHIVPAPVIKFVESFPPIARPRQVVLQLAQAEPHGAPGAPGAPVPPPPVGVPAEADAFAQAITDFSVGTTRNVLGGIFGGETKTARHPVIVGGDAKSAPTIEEDLNVMMRILEKAAGGREEQKARAMGIDVFTLNTSSSPRSFYLEGYGAMFVLSVKYPLLAPPKPEEKRTNETTSSEWERARQEVYGGGARLQDANNPWREPPSAQFDEQRVETLKNQLMDDLANATHIRNLKGDEWVTVVVQGASHSAVRKTQQLRASAGASAGAQYSPNAVAHVRVDNGSPTTMTLRVKKSDVDAVAKGKLKTEEFRKKVSVQIY